MSLLLADHDQRSTPRFACAGEIDAFEGEHGAQGYVASGAAQDISSGGLALRMQCFVAPGTSLRLRNRYAEWSVKVKHVRQVQGKFVVGMEFQGESRWRPVANWPMIFPGQKIA